MRGRLTAMLEAQLHQPPDRLELLTLFLDGVITMGRDLALGLTRDGQKVPLGLRQGSTENAVVCAKLLQDLLGRGLKVERRLLCVLDGGKGLRRALQDVLDTAAVLQRCRPRLRPFGAPAEPVLRAKLHCGTAALDTVQHCLGHPLAL